MFSLRKSRQLGIKSLPNELRRLHSTPLSVATVQKVLYRHGVDRIKRPIRLARRGNVTHGRFPGFSAYRVQATSGIRPSPPQPIPRFPSHLDASAKGRADYLPGLWPAVDLPTPELEKGLAVGQDLYNWHQRNHSVGGHPPLDQAYNFPRPASTGEDVTANHAPNLEFPFPRNE